MKTANTENAIQFAVELTPADRAYIHRKADLMGKEIFRAIRDRVPVPAPHCAMTFGDKEWLSARAQEPLFERSMRQTHGEMVRLFAREQHVDGLIGEEAA